MWWLTQARAALGQAERVLQLGAAGQDRARRAGAGQRQRSPGRSRASGAEHRPRPPWRRGDRAHHASRRCGSRSGGRGPGAGRRSRRAARARRRRGRRSARRTRCRWSSPARSPASREQQVVQRRVGQHHARARARRGATDWRPPARSSRRGASTIGRCGRARAAPARRRRARRALAPPPTIGDHQRERLVLAVLARAQRCHRRLVVGPAGEVKAADALDRDDRAVAQRGGGGATGSPDRDRRRGRPCRRSADRRPARRAGVGLGVEAPVGRVLVLGPAARRTSRSRPSSSAAGRRGRRARS